MSKKQKTLQLGSIKKGQYGPFLSFDSSIKEIQVTREYEINGDKITEVVKVPFNDNGYLNSCNIKKIEEDFAYRVEQGWMEESKADNAIQKLKAGSTPTSSFVTVKVESK
jgi:hypothetical protein